MKTWHVCDNCNSGYNFKSCIWNCKNCNMEICDSCAEIDSEGNLCKGCYYEQNK